MTGKKNAAKVGYDQEEAYFYQHDQELIEKRRGGRKLELVKGQKNQNLGGPSESQTPDARKKRAA